MFICRALSSAVVAAGATVAFAAPALADSQESSYVFNDDQGTTSTWIMVPCGPTCATVISGGWISTANLSNGRWTMVVPNPRGIACTDGTRFGAMESITWDAATLTGRTSTHHYGECGGLPGTRTTNFTMTPR